MPIVLSDPLYEELLNLLKNAEKHATKKEEKDFITKLKQRLEKMPEWRKGQFYSN